MIKQTTTNTYSRKCNRGHGITDYAQDKHITVMSFKDGKEIIIIPCDLHNITMQKNNAK